MRHPDPIPGDTDTAIKLFQLSHQIADVGLSLYYGQPMTPVDNSLISILINGLGDVSIAPKSTSPKKRGSKIKPLPRDPSWFKSSKSNHLTSHGISKLESFYSEGIEPYEAAILLGISYHPARKRFEEWKAKQA